MDRVRLNTDVLWESEEGYVSRVAFATPKQLDVDVCRLQSETPFARFTFHKFNFFEVKEEPFAAEFFFENAKARLGLYRIPDSPVLKQLQSKYDWVLWNEPGEHFVIFDLNLLLNIYGTSVEHMSVQNL